MQLLVMRSKLKSRAGDQPHSERARLITPIIVQIVIAGFTVEQSRHTSRDNVHTVIVGEQRGTVANM